MRRDDATKDIGALLEWIAARPDLDKERVMNADRIRRPLFLAHGQNDPRVPVGESEEMAAAVRKSGTPLWFIVAKDEGHGFARQANSGFLMHAWAFFMEQYLLN